VTPAGAEAEPDAVEAVALDHGWRQTTVTALVHPSSERPFVEAASRTDAATGRLVHRLFQAAPPADASVDDLKELARRLGHRPGEPASDEQGVVETAVDTFLALRRNDDVQQLLAGGEARYEVPFSLRLDESRTLVRGAIDCVVFPSASGAVVFEIKTGRPAAWHRAQVDLYLTAAQQLFPGVKVTGRVVYPQA
jgi:hypothetical protein